jgi:hypothetical protein
MSRADIMFGSRRTVLLANPTNRLIAKAGVPHEQRTGVANAVVKHWTLSEEEADSLIYGLAKISPALF